MYYPYISFVSIVAFYWRLHTISSIHVLLCIFLRPVYCQVNWLHLWREDYIFRFFTIFQTQLKSFNSVHRRQDSLEKIGQGIGRHIYLVAPNLGFELIAITSSFLYQYQRVKIIYLCQPFCQLNHYLPLTRIFFYSCPVWPDWEIFESSWEQSSLQK